MSDIKDRMHGAAERRILFLPHAVRQMSRPDRMISPSDVRQVVLQGEVVEHYPDDPRGESCLMLYFPDSRPMHVICAPKPDYLAIITAYLPNPEQWSRDWKTRN